MTTEEWKDYVEAFKLLTVTLDPSGSGRSIYGQFAYDHDNFAEHQNNLFLAWHRQQLWKWDVALNSVKPGVVQPFFDWSISGEDVFADSMFTADRIGASVRYDGNQVAPIPDGSFQGLQSEHRSQHAVTRNFRNAFLATSRTIDEYINNIDGFERFRLALEYEIHNAFHIVIGGDMVTSMSPNEPLFYFHHAFTDFIYRRWESRGSVGSNTESELGMQMRPWSETTRNVLDGPATRCVSYEGLGPSTLSFISADRQVEVAEEAASSSATIYNEVQFETASEKKEALTVVAQKKVADPSAYKKDMNYYKKIRETASAAAVQMRRDLNQLAAAQKITADLLLKEGIIDISEADKVLAESDEEIRHDGESFISFLS